jgi:hypothetical protein
VATLRPEEAQNFARRRLALQQETELLKNRTNQDLGINQRLLQEAGARGQQEVGNAMASNGLYNSGIRVNEQGQVVREMNEGIGDLNLKTGRTLEDLQRTLAGGLADINFEESGALAARARQEQEDAQRRAELEAQRAAAASGGGGGGGNFMFAPPVPMPILPVGAPNMWQQGIAQAIQKQKYADASKNRMSAFFNGWR